MTAPQSRSTPGASPPSTRPTWPARSGSAAGDPTRHHCPPGRGSTSHPQPSRPPPHHKPPKQPDVSFSLTGSGRIRLGDLALPSGPVAAGKDVAVVLPTLGPGLQRQVRLFDRNGLLL